MSNTQNKLVFKHIVLNEKNLKINKNRLFRCKFIDGSKILLKNYDYFKLTVNSEFTKAMLIG